jgi:hypothetical protein
LHTAFGAFSVQQKTLPAIHPGEWTDENIKLFSNFPRYKTFAERSFLSRV